MYQVLYRKWRPQSFGDVSGQPQVTVTLRNEIKNDRINHAYLFTGSRGTGKTTCAKILAKAVNCLNPKDGEPCGECENCRGIDDGSILDVVEMDAASNRGIADIKSVIDEAQFRPARAKYRVYIIDEVHMLTTEAFNALLKTLEEPPEHVIFILATTEVHKLPTTILSRCQRFDFHRISPEDISRRLRYVAAEENGEIEDDAARLIAAVADGGMRDAISLLDRCLGVSSRVTTQIVRDTAGLARKDYLFELAAACINKNPEKAINIISELHRDSKDMARLCDELLDHFRSLMLIKSTSRAKDMLIMSEDEFETALTQSDYLTLGEIVYTMDVLQNTFARMGKGNSNKTELEMAVIKLSAPELEGTNEALVARVSALEKALKKGVAIPQPAVPEAPAKEEKPAEEPIKQEIVPEPEDIIPIENIDIPEPPRAEVVAEDKPQESAVVENTVSAPASADYNDLYENAKPFRQWPEVVGNIMEYSKAIGSAFVNTKAYESGNYLLIDADSEIAFQLLRQSSQRENIRSAIQEITGRVYKLGPYKKPEKKEEKDDPLARLTEQLRESGIKFNEE